MRVRIQHRTRYIYDGPAALGPHMIRLCPAAHTRAKVSSYALSVAPKGELKWQRDPHGNQVARLTFPVDVEVRALELVVDAVFDIRPVNPFDFFLDERCRELPFAYPDGLDVELAPFLAPKQDAPRGEKFAALAAELRPTQMPTRYVIDYLAAVAAAVRRRVDYVLRDEPGVWSSEETLTQARGSCRDSARLLVDLFRAAGLAARFVSGYLIQLTDEGNLPDEQKGVSQDVVDLHAWCEVFVPGAGWIGIDGTSGLFCNEGHIPLACTVLPEHASPVEGTADRQAVRFEFAMNIGRLGHEFRPRVPYTDETWGDILAAGDAVDAALAAAGLHLTMGGEPTYTSRVHAALPEWNGDALGETKAIAGHRLALSLLDRLGAGGVVLERQGKHYPGESLPRWALELLWRGDGEPIWQDGSLLDRGVREAGGRGLRVDAAKFVARLAEELLLPKSTPPIPAYEDPWVFVAREAMLPDDANALAADLSSPEERRTLARVLGRGLGSVVGYALPVGRDALDAAWVSSAWTFRRGRLFLLPGDSPMGLRLPLDRVGGVAPPSFVADTTAARGPVWVRQAPHASKALPSSSPSGAPLGAGDVLRTAVCVEPRGDSLWVFLPPMPSASAFLALVAAIEKTAAAFAQPVRLEGYGPPSDPRLRRCAVTPDPGVLEVNLPPTGRFADYVPLLETVTHCAVEVGLTTEKFQLDGREVGSGGGHHLTLGGATTVESPWLTRPHLLASLLRFTQNHPSLSYLFSGLFVGPTSQAPRVDEARMDALGELEIALGILERKSDLPPPWFVDRALRNLLIDVTGNTHRTEICIDKLYDPSGVAGRLGLVEMRAFEMPPHERMAAAQMLLVRAIVAAYAKEPYRRPLQRWGSELHDRFMLPHFLWRDFDSVLDDLAQRGVYLPPDAYQPFLEHRFPVLGRFSAEDVTVELRVGLEPWPVLGEEASMSGGTSRYVDSSLERIQVRVDGMTDGRHALLCNGITVPLRATGRASERVAGVRYRAWRAPHSLQPHIDVHHPLRFDLVDTWGKRSLGACTHHVWHPEGRAFTEPPLTVFEAAARRAQRFTTIGHASYPVDPRPATVDPERPFTLDLRRYS